MCVAFSARSDSRHSRSPVLPHACFFRLDEILTFLLLRRNKRIDDSLKAMLLLVCDAEIGKTAEHERVSDFDREQADGCKDVGDLRS